MVHLTYDQRVALWQERFARFLRSNQSAAEFCKNESIGVSTFYKWKRRLIAPKNSSDLQASNTSLDNRFVQPTASHSIHSNPTSFAELIIAEPAVSHSTAPQAKAALPNGITISLEGDREIVSTIVERLLAYQPPAKPEDSGAVPERQASC